MTAPRSASGAFQAFVHHWLQTIMSSPSTFRRTDDVQRTRREAPGGECAATVPIDHGWRRCSMIHQSCADIILIEGAECSRL